MIGTAFYNTGIKKRKTNVLTKGSKSIIGSGSYQKKNKTVFFQELVLDTKYKAIIPMNKFQIWIDG